ncbi:MAG: ABC transporter substrate-binding protein [Deltaproteobacteria bacterium]|nr:ABC transporter substrate-binding protein [Deltaproteobacteria bacterium]
MAAVWIAKDRDIFRKYGLDVRFIQMPKSSVSVAALIAGEIDMAIIGPGHLLNAASGGADVVGVGNLVQNLNYRFVSRPEIKTPEDLRGKRVAISGPGSVSHIIALLALQRLSMDPDQAKISFITIPGTELNRRIALETKNVDASSLLGSVGDLYIKRGYTMLFNFKAAGLTMPQTVLAVTRRTLAAKPEVFDSYLKGFVEAIAYILEPANKSTVMGIIASNLRLDSPAAAEEGYKNVVSSYERIPHLHPEGMKMLHKVLGSLNPKLVNVRPESTVETAPLTRLERSGFVESVYKKP